MAKFFKTRCWEPLLVTFASLFVVSLVANAAAVPFNQEIHGFFGTSDYKEVTAEDGGTSIDRPKLKTAQEIEEYYRSVNKEVEGEGLVLLKNENNALPLAENSKVSFAMGSTGKIFYATHGPGVRRDGEKDGAFYDLKRSIQEETNLQINQATWNFVESGAGKTNRGKRGSTAVTNEPEWKVYDSVKSEYENSTVICVITRESGEGVDVSWEGSDGRDGTYLTISPNELGILEGLAELKAAGKLNKIVVLINSAVTLQCDFIDEEKYGIDAAMWIGLPGATGMKAVAGALAGKINPSGRLSDIFLKDNMSNPAAMYWKINDGFSSLYGNRKEMELDPSQENYGVYVEGVYVGYRYYETRYEDVIMNRNLVGSFDYSSAVAYPFGYGLSYSTFSYSDMKVTKNNDANGKVASYTVEVKVTNTGTVAGKEPVQIYLQKPYSQHDIIIGMEKPSVELVAFEKTKVIAPGASETLSIDVDFEQLRSYDAEADKTYILDEGDYYLTAAKDSHDAINNILTTKGYSVGGNANLVNKVLSQDKVDSEIFSKSSARAHNTPTTLSDEPVGTKITNHLDWMDPNRFKGVKNAASDDGDVTYVSRNNWTGTLPTKAVNLILTGKGAEKYNIKAHKTIVEEEGAKMPNFGGAEMAMTLAMVEGLSYDDPQWEILLDNLTQQEVFETLTQCYGYTPAIASIAKPMTDEDDGPYGVSNTIEGYSSMSCEGIIASAFNKEIYTKVGEAIAADARSEHQTSDKLMQKNLHGLYAPGLNIHRVAFGGRAAEYFSEDPYLTGIASRYEIQAMQALNVVACPKHFIFNDEETNRNGISIWMNEQAAREIYLAPWEESLRPDRANAHSLMTSFNRAGAIWTSASSDLMEDIMRGEWAFDGWTLTDMAGSNGKYFMVYDDGFMNGTDCFLDKATYADMTPEMRNSPTFNQKQRESMHRLLYVTVNYSAAMDGYSTSTKMVKVAVPWKVGLKAFEITAGVLAGIAAALYVTGQVLTFVSKKED